MFSKSEYAVLGYFYFILFYSLFKIPGKIKFVGPGKDPAGK